MKVYIAFLERILCTDKILGVFLKQEDAEFMVKESIFSDFKGRVEEYEVIE